MTARSVHARLATAALARPPTAVEHGEPLLGAEPLSVLGAPRVPPVATAGVKPSRRSLFGPRGAVLLSQRGPLWICDTGHHRLVGYRDCPASDQAPADWVLGQANTDDEGRNRGAATSSTSLNVPTGVCAVESGLAVADAWNHRVLIWREAPTRSNTPPDLVLGQADFESGLPNRGRPEPSENGLHWPYQVASIDGRLLVADAGNRRVLVWNELPTQHGQAADLVLGQAHFACRDENGGRAPDAASMRWPHGICSWRGNLCVADAGNNRILVYDGFPDRSGALAKFILGQTSTTAVDHDQSLAEPRAGTLNMPYACSASGDWLYVADTASSRLLGYHYRDLRTGAAARRLAGQKDFHHKGDNRWGLATGDSFCWPYGVSACDQRLVVADSGNNRVSLWDLLP